MTVLGINFRATSSYDVDGAGETYSLGEAYPVTRGGLTFGWSTNLTASARDRATSYDGKFAGIVFVANGGTARDFTIDLPNGPGTYRVRVALGDATNAQTNQKLVIKDGATTLTTITGSTPAAPQFVDATSVLRATPAAWTSDNVGVDLVFAGSQLVATLGNTGSGTSALAHISVEALASPATATTLTGPTSGTVGVASTNFTVGANGTITGTVTVTPSDGGAGGTFTPTSVNISSGTPTATFTYTAASAGAKTISTTNNGSLTNPSNITYTASTGVVPVTFSGTVAGQSATVGVAFTLNLASYYSGTQTPFTYAVQSGTLPAGLTLSGSTISGTPTTAGTSSGIVVRATDSSSNTADSNSFAITVAAAVAAITSSPLKLNNGSLHLSAPFEAFVLNATTGALVVRKTGLTSHASTGVVTFTDASMTAATQYRVVWRRTDTGATGVELLTAA